MNNIINLQEKDLQSLNGQELTDTYREFDKRTDYVKGAILENLFEEAKYMQLGYERWEEYLPKELGVSTRTAHNLRNHFKKIESLSASVADTLKPDLIEKILPTKEQTQAVKDVPIEDIIELIEHADEEDTPKEIETAILAKAKKINDKKKEEKKEAFKKDIAEQKEAIENGTLNLPEGKYEAIAIDPPWSYGREYDPESSRVANPYPEMAQDELMELEIPSADDSVMFLWTTHAFIFDAKELLDHWGFEYKATMVWNKEKIGMGHWLRMQCEFCLVGIKGKPNWNNTTWRDIITESRREHSRKPEAFYKMVDEIIIGRKLEYFSRTARDGWEVFGNDIGRLSE